MSRLIRKAPHRSRRLSLLPRRRLVAGIGAGIGAHRLAWPWRKTSSAGRPMARGSPSEVQSYVKTTSINASGDLSLTATDSNKIDSFVSPRRLSRRRCRGGALALGSAALAQAVIIRSAQTSARSSAAMEQDRNHRGQRYAYPAHDSAQIRSAVVGASVAVGAGHRRRCNLRRRRIGSQ